MKFVRSVLNRPVTTVMLILAIVVFGVQSLMGMPLEYIPSMDMPMEMVMIVWPGSDADSVDRLVTQPIEDTCEALSDVDTIYSYSFDNYAMIGIQYKWGTDMDDAYSSLRSAVDLAMTDLPGDCNDPIIMELNTNSMSMSTMMLTVSAPGDFDISNYLDEDVVPALESLSGVAQVSVTGSQEDYIRIVVDEAAMKQYGLSISGLGSAIAGADFDMPVGSVSLGSQDVSLGVYGSVTTELESLRSLPIQTPYGHTVKMSDVCTFLDFYQEDAGSITRYNGQGTVMLSVTKQDSAATMDVCNRVLSTLEEYSVDGVSFTTIYSEGENVRDTMGNVLQTLIIGVICTMVVIFLFFGNVRASLIVGMSMPLSILLAMICMSYAGFNLDLMTGAGLIIAIGMIVDNSIVVMEACMRYRSEGLTPKEAAVQGTSTMIMSILGGTLTTVVVYVPLAMLKGLIGQLAGPLCWTIMFCLICSFLSAVVVVPLAYMWLKPVAREDIPINRFMRRLQKGYRSVMPKLLRHPGRVVMVGVLCFALAIGMLTQMDVIMMPNNYDGSISISVSFRSGTKLEVMDENIQEIEQALLEDEKFEKVITQISNGSSLSLSGSGSSASFTAYAVADCDRTSEEMVEEYATRFGTTPGMDVSVSPTSGSGASISTFMSGNSKEIEVQGDDLDDLKVAASQIEEVMRQTPGVIDVANDFSQSRVKGKIVINSQKAIAAGSSEQAIAGQIYYALNGMTATELEYGDSEYDVIIEYPEGKYDTITDLLDFPLMTSSGRQLSLRDLADVEYVTTLPSILREDGHYITSVTATTTSTGSKSAGDAIDAAVAQLELPEGVSLATGVMDESTQETTDDLIGAMATAIFLVFLVMAIQFGAPRLSIMVMMCIPLSLIGSFGFLFLLGRDLSMIGLMGVLVLVGISVNNGIYLVDAIDQLRQTMPLKDALVQAGATRLRPILMTTLTTIASMVPMIFSSDRGMSMTKDMAYIVIGGLVASTILAMFLMPCFYILIRRENLDGTFKSKKKEAKRQAALAARAAGYSGGERSTAGSSAADEPAKV